MDLKSPASGPAAASTAASAPAAPPSAPQAASTAEPGLPLIRASETDAPYGSLLSTVITVALVGAAVIWALRRSGLGRLRAAPANARMLQVRETVHVAPKVRVTYLRCGEHELLLAHSEHSQAWITLPPASPVTPPSSPTPHAPQDPANAA